jgi:hypothetical protein
MRFSVTGMTTAVTAPRKGVTDFGYTLGCYGIMDIKKNCFYIYFLYPHSYFPIAAEKLISMPNKQ